MSPTHYLSWEEWQDYCLAHGLNPREQSEDGHDLGGGNSMDFVCYEDPPEKEKEIKEGRKK